ncbi:hypothetical protein QR98_0072360 [Sarcoptes scabiei]|uniref:Uncharacterized protein n=1 Tax=Sarcoptes scabiei TaxID=52283 RepID=A0A132ACK9_SARSC|nr:hypothetical protein QR98_0072360 [Sarcoptes scabiei]
MDYVHSYRICFDHFYILISISCTNTERDGLVLDQRQQQTRTVVISKSFDDKPPCYDEALSQ